ncbi:putative PTS sugar transporter subunit IIA [Actinobacillus pleuropneumoniae]|nr:putative PTS sugar transporter subunit IIA [Actinobacillus pleuropneumoniae]KIE93302.1 putative PTS sugar transporter subunit IIA [Actinobacillus pleuropneumoniae]KIE99457.1 putative PTS sugar transporter subunit IIA [Actinobacillus pleuropneumoniae]KIE99652.1 putative PTS sugar transporter subunit IIA [Actinobacillus pleuropneumoniae]
MPHAKFPDSIALAVDKPIAAFIQLEKPIDYEAHDNKEVDLVYAIMIPSSCCEQYKNGLQEIAQRLNDKTLTKQLRSANNAEEIWQLLVYADNQILEQE